MPLPAPPDQLTALQIDRLIAHLLADTTVAPYINPPHAYPPHGVPPVSATEQEDRCLSIKYADGDSSRRDNQTRTQESRYVLLDALWRYKKDTCPDALWQNLRMHTPTDKVERVPEGGWQVVTISFWLISSHTRRPY
jgi:hypothetical protein